MRCKPAFIVALMMTATTGSDAQTITKSIGPDGRVTYSDGPRTAAPTDSPVAPATPLPAEPSAAPSDLETSSSPPMPHPNRHLGAKQAIRAKTPVASETATTAPVDPAVAKAVIGVMGMEDLVQRTETLCTRVLPTSFKRYGNAARDWNERNATALTELRRVLSQAFAPTQSQLLRAGVEANTESMLAPIRAAPLAKQIAWCDQSADAIDSGSMDVVHKANLTAPLQNYQR